MAVADYRIVYRPDPRERAREYDWAAKHFDRVILDSGDTLSVREYRRRNPEARLFHYALLWSVELPGEEPRADAAVSYYGHMQRWYAAHPRFVLERAFLHDARRCPPPSAPRADCRVTVVVWKHRRWVTNPGDGGARAYHAARLAAVAADADGAFVDEHGSGDIRDRLRPFPLREYDDWAAYERDVVALLRTVRRALDGDRRLLLNTSQYHGAWDREMVTAAGGMHAEGLNSPFTSQMEERWRFVDDVVAAGAAVDMSAGGETPPEFVGGNALASLARRRLWELASYYLVVSSDPARVAFSVVPRWDRPYPEQWVGAVETDLGRPLAVRSLLVDQVDPAGGAAHVWVREFERALVFVRPVVTEPPLFGEAAAIAVPLGRIQRYRPLLADGTVGPPLDALRLRPGEGAILLKIRPAGAGSP